MDIEEWRRWLGSPDSHPLRRVPNARTQWECICRSRGGEGRKGRLAPEPGRRSENHAPIPRLWWHVHGALPQHRARRQRDALEVGNRRFGNSVSATAADSHSETTRRHVYASGRHTSERFLRAKKGDRPDEYTPKNQNAATAIQPELCDTLSRYRRGAGDVGRGWVIRSSANHSSSPSEYCPCYC